VSMVENAARDAYERVNGEGTYGTAWQPGSAWSQADRAARTRLEPLRAAQFLEFAFPTEEWIIDRLLPATGLGLILAAEKTGKSLFALQMALSIAAGVPFLGRTVKQANVLLVEEEGSQRGFQKRLERQMLALALAGTDPPAHFLVRAQVRVDDATILDDLRAVIVRDNIRVLVVGPLSQIAQIEDENKAGEVNALCRTLNELATELRLAVVVIHHRRKGSAGQGAPKSISGFFESGRGSNALIAAMDVGIGLYREQEDGHAWLYALHRDAESFREYVAFDRDSLCFSESDQPAPTGTTPRGNVAQFLTPGRIVTPSEVAVALGISRNTAQTRLDELAASGEVTMDVGVRRRREYKLVDAPEPPAHLAGLDLSTLNPLKGGLS
jgi:hypothetical protein